MWTSQDFQGDQTGSLSADPVGIRAWSLSRGIEPTVGLTLVSLVLSVVAANSVNFGLSSPLRTSPGISLALCESDTPLLMATGDLLDSLLRRQTGLVQRTNGFSTTELETAFHEGGFLPRNHDFLKTLGNPGQVASSTFEVSVEQMLDRDSAGCVQTIDMEKILRPGFLVRGGLRGDPVKLASHCHGGQGFAAGVSVVLPPGGAGRKGVVDSLLAAVRGVEIERRFTSRTALQQELVSLRGIFRLEAPDLDWIIRERRDLARNLLPVTSSPPGDELEVDDYAAARFVHTFNRVATRALACRREGAMLEGNFQSTPAELKFLRLQRLFLSEMQRYPERLRVPALESLPARIAWAMLVIAGHEDIDDNVLQVSFETARELHARLLHQFEVADNEALAIHRLKCARKMVTRVKRLASCSRRDLVRGFDKQGLELHEPVIQSLIAAGVFQESPDGRLSPGSVPVEHLSVENVIPFIRRA